ncbi:MAG TPA: erythromycin esterase family protein, partial [Patescibacteria group bacterium]|nr:erythromycin esterase family protein [Patescibacteria group bacterium]
MTRSADKVLTAAIERRAVHLSGELTDFNSIIDAARNKSVVMIGEASHGTEEFYRTRAEITQRLIQELNFDAVAVEADWPDAYRVNKFVSLRSEETATESLSDFERFPVWMWRNHEVFKFIEWLHAYNYEYRRSGDIKRFPAGFYGLDLYSMGTSIRAVIDYLDEIDPPGAQRARERYSCLDHFMDNPQGYGYAAEFGIADSCEKDILAQLIDLRIKSYEYAKRDGIIAEDEYFCAEQNAKLVKNAEEYYRSMFRGRPNSWNLRDQHMFETLQDLAENLRNRLQREPRIVVWAHNSHIGDAAATEMSDRGELNIGQLVRQKYGDRALLIGFSTCRGTVMAADDWEGPHRAKRINEPFPGSYEDVFGQVNQKSFMLDLRESNDAVDLLMTQRLQRAIGVIYRPETERHSHYFLACLPKQFDFMIHYDETHAVLPIQTVM